MKTLTKNNTIAEGLEISESYKAYYAKMSAGTVETFRILSDEIDKNIAVINDTLSTGYYTGDFYKMLWESKCNFVHAQKSLETNTLKFLGIR